MKNKLSFVYLSAFILFLAGCQSKPSHYGVFLMNGFDYVEIPVQIGPPGSDTAIGVSAGNNKPSIYLYTQNTNLDNLIFQNMETNTGVEYQAKPSGNGAYELTVTNDLVDGTYCLAQNDPANQPENISYWCFMVGTKPAPIATQELTWSPEPSTPEQLAVQPYFEKYLAALKMKKISNVEYATGKMDGNKATVIISYDMNLEIPPSVQSKNLPKNQLVIKTQYVDGNWKVDETGIENILGAEARAALEVARVNGDAITAGEFQTQVKIRRIQSINRYNQYLQYAQTMGVQDPKNDANFGPLLQQEEQLLSSTDTLGGQIIDLLVSDRLIRQEAARRNISISDQELEKTIQESFNYFANGTPTPRPVPTQISIPTRNSSQPVIVTMTPVPSQTPTSTPAPFLTPVMTATIIPTATQVSLESYMNRLKLREEGLLKDTGMDEAGYWRYVETSLLSTRLFEVVTRDMVPIQEQVWARHILVKTIEEAADVEARLAKGEDFSKVAAEVSTDTGTKDRGGDLGWFGKGIMVAPFEDAAFAEQIGEVSQPVKTDFGYHIIQVLGHEERPLTEQEFIQLKQTVYTEFLNKLRESSTVEIFDLWKIIVPTEPSLPVAGQ